MSTGVAQQMDNLKKSIDDCKESLGLMIYTSFEPLIKSAGEAAKKIAESFNTAARNAANQNTYEKTGRLPDNYKDAKSLYDNLQDQRKAMVNIAGLGHPNENTEYALKLVNKDFARLVEEMEKLEKVMPYLGQGDAYSNLNKPDRGTPPSAIQAYSGPQVVGPSGSIGNLIETAYGFFLSSGLAADLFSWAQGQAKLEEDALFSGETIIGNAGTLVDNPQINNPGDLRDILGIDAFKAELRASFVDASGYRKSEVGQISGAAADASSGDSGFLAILESAGGAFGSIANLFNSSLGSMLGSLGSVQALLSPIQTILGAAMDVLGPVINDTLAPLVGALKIVGKAIGEILSPVIKALSPIIQALGEAFAWFYNNVLRPVGNALYASIMVIVNGIINFGTLVGNIITHILEPSKWKAGTLSVNWSELYANGPLKDAISTSDLAKAGATAYTSSTGTAATYSGAQNITFNFFNQGNVVGAGGMQELAQIIDSLIRQNARYA
jgi:hypothetical protein